jgi:hypothetical protein
LVFTLGSFILYVASHSGCKPIAIALLAQYSQVFRAIGVKFRYPWFAHFGTFGERVGDMWLTQVDWVSAFSAGLQRA